MIVYDVKLPNEDLACRTMRAFLDGMISPAQYIRYRDIQTDGVAGVVMDELTYIAREEARQWRRNQRLGFMGLR